MAKDNIKIAKEILEQIDNISKADLDKAIERVDEEYANGK